MKFFETLLSGLKAAMQSMQIHLYSKIYTKEESDERYPKLNSRNKIDNKYLSGNFLDLDTINYVDAGFSTSVLASINGKISQVPTQTLANDCLVFTEYSYNKGFRCSHSFADAKEIVETWCNAKSYGYKPKIPIIYEARYRGSNGTSASYPYFYCHCVSAYYDSSANAINMQFVDPDGVSMQNVHIQDVKMDENNNITKRTVTLSNAANVREQLSDKITSPATATVGQTITVKSVDDNGKPTEWEAVDSWVIPSSTEGSVKKFKLTVDDSGTLTAAEIV